MDANELRAALEADGWRFGKALRATGVDWYAWRSLDGAVNCACNDKPPPLVLQPYVLDHSGIHHRSVEFEVIGEGGGQWLKLQAYSVPMDAAMAAIPRCTELLRAAWNAAAALEQVA